MYVLCFSVYVLEHRPFLKLPYGSKMKINLILNSSLVQLYYTRNNKDFDPRTPYLLLDKGEFTDVYTFLITMIMQSICKIYILHRVMVENDIN